VTRRALSAATFFFECSDCWSAFFSIYSRFVFESHVNFYQHSLLFRAVMVSAPPRRSRSFGWSSAAIRTVAGTQSAHFTFPLRFYAATSLFLLEVAAFSFELFFPIRPTGDLSEGRPRRSSYPAASVRFLAVTSFAGWPSNHQESRPCVPLPFLLFFLACSSRSGRFRCGL